MAEGEDYNLLCSGCYTPTPAAECHVVPHWNPKVRRVLTSYRCANCWLDAIAETRSALKSGEAELVASFCDFLARQGYDKDADTIRAAPSDRAQAMLLAVLDATQEAKVVFHP